MNLNKKNRKFYPLQGPRYVSVMRRRNTIRKIKQEKMTKLHTNGYGRFPRKNPNRFRQDLFHPSNMLFQFIIYAAKINQPKKDTRNFARAKNSTNTFMATGRIFWVNGFCPLLQITNYAFATLKTRPKRLGWRNFWKTTIQYHYYRLVRVIKNISM